MPRRLVEPRTEAEALLQRELDLIHGPLAVAEGGMLLEQRVWREHEPFPEELPLVGQRRQEISCGEDSEDVLAGGPEPVAGELVGAHPVRSVAVAEDGRAGGDPLDRELLEVLEPAVECGRVGTRVGVQLGA